MNQETLARQAELALDRQGDYDSLFYEGRTLCGLLASTAQRRGGEPATPTATTADHGRPSPGSRPASRRSSSPPG